ncbi:phage tail protein [Nitrincola sp. A-D6]|uniref:phage tail protein n=1 Tax=Nitrincola sp. A-D6 TaxID=1545442 RepID=UPI00068C34EF|nr:phage tail protein [Nitrincola sp. A-D6]
MNSIIDTLLPAFSFHVGFIAEDQGLSLGNITGLIAGGFSEVSGLDNSMSIETYLEGGVNDRVHRLPGRFEPANITLTHGTGLSDDLWNWLAVWQRGEAERRSMFIMLANAQQIPIKIWAAERALPVKFTGPSLNASSSALAIEKLEIAPEKLTLLLSPGFATSAMGL